MHETTIASESMTLDQREVATRAVLYGLKELGAMGVPDDALKPRAVALAEAMVAAVAIINKVSLDTGVPGSCCAPLGPGVIHEVKG